MLRRDSLPDATRQVFEHLAANVLLDNFTLIGGTALALQIGHRRSEDLDFWTMGESLDKERISALVRMAQQAGFATMLATPHHRIVAEKINGRDLLARVQDYVIGDVKVTFFARADEPYRYFDTLPRVDNAGTSFRVMSEEGLFAMKSHVIHQRLRSRDLFDLKAFLARGKTVADILQIGIDIDPACSPEYAKSVLVGEIPLDKDDEGFDSIGVAESMEEVYAFFKAAVDEYEQGVAEDTLRNRSEGGAHRSV